MKTKIAVFVAALGFLVACGKDTSKSSGLFLGSLKVNSGGVKSCTEFTAAGDINESKIPGVKSQLSGLGDFSETRCSREKLIGVCAIEKPQSEGTIYGEIFITEAPADQLSKLSSDCSGEGGTWSSR